MKKQQVQEALKRIDGLLSRAKIVEPVLSRQDHIILVNDLNLVQQCCLDYFDNMEGAKESVEEKKDV